MTNLATRAEQAAPEDARALLVEAFALVHGRHPSSLVLSHRAFIRKLDAEAYLDAAMMLIPEGIKWSVSTFGARGGTAQIDNRCRTAATPALALLAAIIRAKGATHADG